MVAGRRMLKERSICMGSFLHEGDITEQSAGTPAAGRIPESSLIRRIAVCVCTSCRPGSLLRLLTLLEHAEAPAGATEMLLVVIDNRPGGETPEILARAAPRLPFRTILEAEPTPGISFARNRAVVVA